MPCRVASAGAALPALRWAGAGGYLDPLPYSPALSHQPLGHATMYRMPIGRLIRIHAVLMDFYTHRHLPPVRWVHGLYPSLLINTAAPRPPTSPRSAVVSFDRIGIPLTVINPWYLSARLSASIGVACCTVTTRSNLHHRCWLLCALNHMSPPRPARAPRRPQLQEEALASGQQCLDGAVHCGGDLPVTRCTDYHRQGGGQCYQRRAKHAGTPDSEMTHPLTNTATRARKCVRAEFPPCPQSRGSQCSLPPLSQCIPPSSVQGISLPLLRSDLTLSRSHTVKEGIGVALVLQLNGLALACRKEVGAGSPVSSQSIDCLVDHGSPE